MLVLTRKVGEEIVIDDKIRIRVVAIQRGRTRIGVTAPESVIVDRAEVVARRNASEAPRELVGSVTDEWFRSGFHID